jgi:hypothetical protein
MLHKLVSDGKNSHTAAYIASELEKSFLEMPENSTVVGAITDNTAANEGA